MGASGARNGGGRDTSANNVPPSRRRFQPVTGTLSDPREKDDTEAKASLFKEQGATNIRNLTSKVPSPTLVIASGPLQAGSRITRDFFTNKVLGSKNYSGTTKVDFQKKSLTEQNKIYSSYIEGRLSGKTDAYGNPMGGGNDNQPSMIKKNIGGKIVSVAPTKAEVSQSEAVNATSEEDSIYLRKKKTKAKGRSQTILTSSKGVATDEGLTLGKKSLLGIS